MVNVTSVRCVFFILLVNVYCVHCQNLQNTTVWQGFEHRWERRALKVVETPHRMGSFANYILNEEFNSTSQSFQANQTFTPGVNGDYSYPKTYFSLLSNVGVINDVIDFQFFDQSTQTDNPMASFNYSFSINTQIPENSLTNGKFKTNSN